MKKTYISPALLVVQLTSRTTILEASAPSVGLDGSLSVDAGSVDTKGFSGNSSVWDEEW
jgi:hypothetical protein